MKKVLLLSITLMSALLITSCGAIEDPATTSDSGYTSGYTSSGATSSSGGSGAACHSTDTATKANWQCYTVGGTTFNSSNCSSGGGFTNTIMSSCPSGYIGYCYYASKSYTQYFYSAALQGYTVTDFKNACKSNGGSWT